MSFVVTANRGEKSLTALRQEFGISRPTGYLWLSRYRQEGLVGIAERSRRPARSPDRTAAEVEEAVGAARPAVGQTFRVLYTLGGYPTDGSGPLAGLVMDAAGNLYGTTAYGGSDSCPGGNGVGCGTVFELDTSGVETVLHNFTGHDGANPAAPVMMAPNGDLYGTTEYGGLITHCTEFGSYPGCGVVFKLRGRKETVLHAFRGDPHDGNRPVADLIMDSQGNLYSTTAFGGAGYGTVFEVTAAGKEKVLYSFAQLQDGQGPAGGVVRDAQGNLYGSTEGGEQSYPGDVFEVTKDGKEEVLHTFCSEQDCADGVYPTGDLVMDAKGNLYGTTTGGGIDGKGVIFMITP